MISFRIGTISYLSFSHRLRVNGASGPSESETPKYKSDSDSDSDSDLFI